MTSTSTSTQRVEVLELPEELREQFGPSAQRPKDESPERVLVARHAALPGLETWTARDSRRLWSVFHTTYAFCAATAIKGSGKPRWKYRHRDYDMDLASVRLLEPGETHVTLCNPWTDFEVLMIDPSLVGDPETHRPVHFGTGQVEDAGLALALLRLGSCLRRAQDELEVEGQWCEVRERLLERGRADAGRVSAVCSSAVRHAREYLHANFSSRIGLGEIAEVANLSKFHLARSFRKYVGISIHRYLVTIRLGHATELLRRGYNLNEVAERVGFWDAPHLTRAFVADFGITPGAYAALGRKRRHTGENGSSRRAGSASDGSAPAR